MTDSNKAERTWTITVTTTEDSKTWTERATLDQAQASAAAYAQTQRAIGRTVIRSRLSAAPAEHA